MGLTDPVSSAEYTQDVTLLEGSRYVLVASYALLLYDFVLTLPQEMNVVWRAKWSIVKILFLINRYTVPVVVTFSLIALSGLTTGLTPQVCQGVILIVIYWQLLSLAFVDVIVTLRIHALWQRRKSVFLILACFFLVTYVAATALAVTAEVEMYDSIGYKSAIGQFLGGICIAFPPPIIWAVWLPVTVYEAIVCLITFYRTWQHYTVDRLPFRESLVSDGLIYFLMAFLTRLFEILIFSLAPDELMISGENLAFVLNTVVCSRLLLNLRGIRKQEDWSEQTDILMSTPSFPEQPVLWLADQGGQSFLEQIYQRAYTPDTRRVFTHVEQFVVPPDV